MTTIRLAGCIVTDTQGKILLIHRNKNGRQQWETPGGKVEPGETDNAAALRELKEELGVEVVLGNKLGEGDFQEGDALLHYVWFSASLPNLPLTLEAGFDDCAYHAWSDLVHPQKTLSAGTKTFVSLVNSGKITL